MMMIMITSCGRGVATIMLLLMIILAFTTFSCSGLSCVHCHAKDKTDDPCVTGSFDSYKRACCPMMSNPYCIFEFLVDPNEETVDEVKRGCAPRPAGKGSPGCYEVKEKDGDQMGRQSCMCFEDNCNTANPLKPDEIKAIARSAKADGTGKGGASSPFVNIGYGTVVLAAFFVALCHAFTFV